MNLSNRVAIITGAAQGIGEAIAMRMAGAGADIAVVDLNLPGAEAVAERIRKQGRRSLAVWCDVSRVTEIDEALKHVLSDLGQIDILVNNTGIAGRSVPIGELTLAEWEQVLKIDLTSVFLWCKAVVPQCSRGVTERL